MVWFNHAGIREVPSSWWRASADRQLWRFGAASENLTEAGWRIDRRRARPRIPGHAVRLGLRCAKGPLNADGARIVAARSKRPYTSITDLWRRAGVASAALVRLARADAFGSLSLSRREALWAIKALRDDPLPLFAAADARRPAAARIRRAGRNP